MFNIVYLLVELRNNSQMPGSMLILTWVGIIRELFRFLQGIYDNCMHSSVPRQRLFLDAVPNTSRYYLQEYITLQKRY
jgi:hypothetical protein